MSREINHPYSAIYHIGLALDVWATLIVGRERAVLVDTGFGIDEAEFLRADIRMPEPLEADLGGTSEQVIHLPGHTPGSAVLFISKYRLLHILQMDH